MTKHNTKSLHFGLYGEDSSPFLPDFVHYELLELRSQIHNWEIDIHVHPQLCQFFIFESGKVILKMNEKEINLPLSCLLFIPENTMHGFSFQPNSSGRVLTMSSSFVETLFQSSPELLEAFSKFQVISAQTQNSMFERIKHLFTTIQEELVEDQPQRNVALQARLVLFFIEIFRLSDRYNDVQASKIEDRNLRYYQDFQRLIKKLYLSQTPLSEYANQLNITPIHLNRICNNVVGKTASLVLQEYIIHEAKKYLQHTSYSISEIAYRLNFEYPSYFTRLFKKHTGKSPIEFRGNEHIARV